MEAYKRRGSLWLEGFSDSHHCWTDSVSSSCLLLTPWVILSKPTAPKQYPPPTPHTLCTQRYKHASYFTHARVQNLHPFKQAFCLIPTNCSKFPSLWALPWSPSWHPKVTKIQRCHKQVLFKRQHTRTPCPSDSATCFSLIMPSFIVQRPARNVSHACVRIPTHKSSVLPVINVILKNISKVHIQTLILDYYS